MVNALESPRQGVDNPCLRVRLVHPRRRFRTWHAWGTGFFDAKGHYFKTPDEATISDLSAILGKIGDGESLAPGIAHTLLHRRSEIEQLFTDHDRMLAEYEPVGAASVTRLETRLS